MGDDGNWPEPSLTQEPPPYTPDAAIEPLANHDGRINWVVPNWVDDGSNVDAAAPPRSFASPVSSPAASEHNAHASLRHVDDNRDRYGRAPNDNEAGNTLNTPSTAAVPGTAPNGDFFTTVVQIEPLQPQLAATIPQVSPTPPSSPPPIPADQPLPPTRPEPPPPPAAPPSLAPLPPLVPPHSPAPGPARTTNQAPPPTQAVPMARGRKQSQSPPDSPAPASSQAPRAQPHPRASATTLPAPQYQQAPQLPSVQPENRTTRANANAEALGSVLTLYMAAYTALSFRCSPANEYNDFGVSCDADVHPEDYLSLNDYHHRANPGAADLESEYADDDLPTAMARLIVMCIVIQVRASRATPTKTYEQYFNANRKHFYKAANGVFQKGAKTRLEAAPTSPSNVADPDAIMFTGYFTRDERLMFVFCLVTLFLRGSLIISDTERFARWEREFAAALPNRNVRQCAAHLANQEKPNRLGWIYLWAKQDDLIDLDVIPPAELMDLTGGTDVRDSAGVQRTAKRARAADPDANQQPDTSRPRV